MKHLAGGINPDHGIKVATVYPDGTAKVWDTTKEGHGARRFLYSRSFPTYGKAKLWAVELEAANRRSKLKELPK